MGYDLVEMVRRGLPPQNHCGSERFAVRQQAGAVCPYATLPADYDALLSRLSGHARQRERRQVRKLKADFQVEMRLVETADELDQVWPAIVALNIQARSRWNTV